MKYVLQFTKRKRDENGEPYRFRWGPYELEEAKAKLVGARLLWPRTVRVEVARARAKARKEKIHARRRSVR